MTVIHGYFDDSTREDITVVAGYVAKEQAWKRFEMEWNRVIATAPHAIREYKATDCFQGANEFTTPWTPEQRTQLTADLVEIIVKHTDSADSFGVCVAIQIPLFDTSEMRNHAARSFNKKRSMLLFHYATHQLFRHTMARIADVFGSADHTLLFTFDKQKKQEGAIHEYAAEIASEVAKGLHCPKPNFEDSKRVVLLQAADLFAYYGSKEARRIADGGDGSMHPVLARLVKERRHEGVLFNARFLKCGGHGFDVHGKPLQPELLFNWGPEHEHSPDGYLSADRTFVGRFALRLRIFLSGLRRRRTRRAVRQTNFT